MKFRSCLRATILGLAVVGPTVAQPAVHSSSASTRVRGWPRIVGDGRNLECRQAYRLAKSTFQSPQFSLQGPFEPIPDLGSTFSVYRVEADLSAGGGLASDPGAFEAIKLPDNGGALFWQRNPRNGMRVAVLESPFGWRGDTYTTVVVPESTTLDAVMKGSASEDPSKAASKPLFGGFRWNPPLVLSNRKSGAPWIIDSGEPYESLPDWRVYGLVGSEARSLCSIAFRPKVKASASLLPAPVQRFATLLDDALGPGKDEGTLQPTARTRMAVANGWADASMRPWSVVAGSYNTHREVDAGLEQWAAGSKARTSVYRAIREQYGPAEQAMASFYGQAFGLSPREAQAAGRYVIDAMFRQYFTFHREGDVERAAENPWPAHVR
jgi:hypothetical protein